MKVVILTFLVCAALSKGIEKHFHYHLDGLSPQAQRELMQLNPKHKGFFRNVWCFMKNPFSKDKRRTCIEAAKEKNEKEGAPEDKNADAKRLLEANSDHLFKNLNHKLDWKKTKCRALYFWNKKKREECLEKAKRKLMANFSGLGNPNHKGFWSQLKCLLKHPFKKDKRQECNEAAKAANKEDDSDKQSVKSDAKVSAQHRHVLDSTRCFFKYMFNKKKRTECYEKSKKQREANKKAAEEEKEAAKKAEEEKKAEEKKKESRIGLDAKGKKRSIGAHRNEVHRHFHF